MEGHGGNLEGEASQEEDEAEHQARTGARLHGGGDAGEADTSGEAVDERGAIKEHAGGQGPEHEIFEAGLARLGIVAVDRGEHVKREARQLEADVKRDEIIRGYHQKHAERRQQDEDSELERLLPVPAHLVDGERQGRCRAEKRHNLHEPREIIDDERAVECHLCLGSLKDSGEGGDDE